MEESLQGRSILYVQAGNQVGPIARALCLFCRMAPCPPRSLPGLVWQGGVNGGYETIADIYSVGSVFAREIQREILDENWDWILGAVPAIWAA